jgi:hypothetical protein
MWYIFNATLIKVFFSFTPENVFVFNPNEKGGAEYL